MEERKEIVTTRIYTVKDMKQLLGEGKTTINMSVAFPCKEGAPRWLHAPNNDDNLLRIEIREPYVIEGNKK